MTATVTRRVASALKPFGGPGGFWRCADGATAVEFGLVAAPLLALILAIIQVGLIIYASHSLQTAAAAASRLILTGQVQTQNMQQGDFVQAVCGDASSLFACSGLMVDVQSSSSFPCTAPSLPSLTYDAQGNVTNAWGFNPGGPGDIVVMRLMYRWPVFLGPLGLNLSNLGNGYRLLMATSAFKNEPYK
jgi:Flp pilus assembly protein TadG